MSVLKACVLCVLFGLFAASPVLAESIVGAWTVSAGTQAEGATVLVFLANGYYFAIDNARESDAPGGVDGFERGSYTWNPTTGAVNFTTLQDTNGNLGMSGLNGAAGVNIVVAGNNATVTIPGKGSIVFNRVTGSSPLVGSWHLGNATVADSSFVVVFLPNGVYFMVVDQAPGNPNGPDGIEHGTYVWDPVTGAITSSRTPAPYVDTNGSWGLSDPSVPLVMEVSPDGLVLTVIEGSDKNTVSRIGAANSQVFQINAGLNDAWYDPATNGQGFFVSVLSDMGVVVLSWFTYDTVRPAASVTANLGEPGHRWLTAVGQYAGNQAVLNISYASGGLFDSDTPVSEINDGTIILTFSDCNTGTVEYDIPSIGRQGSVPIQRVADDNIALCESLRQP